DLPAAGAYRLRTTGTAQVLPLQVAPEPLDEDSTRTVEHLNDTDVRQSEVSGQTTDLRYLGDQVQLLRLDVVFPGVLEYHFVAEPPVLFARLPLVAGDSWQWQLSESGGRTTVTQSTTVRAPERIDVAGGTVDAPVMDTTITFAGELTGTVQLTGWFDPARRTSVRTHQVTDLTYQAFRVVSDTTTDLVSFTPA
ncbi:MAG: hypothetical protein H0W25_07450, partial [Acidimicrobiia bacterium]|nr:hypothetical protein [Acidimicrobiia bacterium]